MAQPNILLIQSDQHRFDCVAANGHPFVRTPNLDRLAAEGVNFTHAFSPIPVCVPARNSLIYGVWPTRHLAIANWDTEAPRPAHDGLTPYTEVLRSAGYRLAHVGKWHIHPAKGPTDYGFHECVPLGDYFRWREANHLPPVPKHDWTGGCDPGVQAEQSQLGWGATTVIRVLRNCADAGRPFYIEWDTKEPHIPNIAPEPFFSMYRPSDIPPWTGFPDPLVGKPFIQRQQRRSWKVDGWTWENWAPIVARYLGVISLLDAQVGRVLAEIDSLGLRENTVVIYTTDHGDMCGNHGMVDKHYVLYDDVTRVPLILRWPAAVGNGQTCGAFVIHALDLAATFCELAGEAPPAEYAGESLLDLLLDRKKETSRADAFAMYHGNQFGLYTQRMIRNKKWKYIWNATAEDELYDLGKDPGELVNLAQDKSSADILADLRKRLFAWMEATDDPLTNTWIRGQFLEGTKP